MSLEKRNVVEDKRTPDHELNRSDDNWDKEAADIFKSPSKVEKSMGPIPESVSENGETK